MSVFTAVLARDLRLALRQSADSLTVVAFFAIITMAYSVSISFQVL